MYLGPEPCTLQPASHFRSSPDRGAVERQQEIPRANPCASCWRIRGNLAGLNAVVGIEPSYSIVYHFKAGALVEVNQGKNHRRQRG